MPLSAPRNGDELAKELLPLCEFSDHEQARIIEHARRLILTVRTNSSFNVESFMQQFSLSTEEGVAIMCLAEGLLRVKDKGTAMFFAKDLLAKKNWLSYINQSKSLKAFLASTGLCFAGKFADLGSTSIEKILLRLGQQTFLFMLYQAIKFLGSEFVFATDIENAIAKAAKSSNYKFSFDMLGESARTHQEASRYYSQYLKAVKALKTSWPHKDTMPDLSVKLTALDPRVEWAKLEDLKERLLPKLITLVKEASDGGISITFDAEEAKRLDVYLELMESLLMALPDCSYISLVIQAYQVRAYEALDRVISIAKQRGSPVHVRLVKGAYWDAEIKYAQENCLEQYPVFTCKEHTDVSYVACANKMLANDGLILPHFATHNALTVATIISMSHGKNIEFQKLHGMGNVLYTEIVKDHSVRVYAPVGEMHDLLAYLMRRMLENGSSACFVNKVNNKNIPVEELAYNLYHKSSFTNGKLSLPRDIYSDRRSAMGFSLGYALDYQQIYKEVSQYFGREMIAASIINGKEILHDSGAEKYGRPAKVDDILFTAHYSTKADMELALLSAHNATRSWQTVPVSKRAEILNKIAEIFEDKKFELYALLMEEAGKTISDAIAEVAEAIDFCNYYSKEALKNIQEKKLEGPTGESNTLNWCPRGVFLCISPWNFPLAIFAGQILAALVCGNTVIAKPADHTPAIANLAVRIMHQAGIPKEVLHLVLARGQEISDYFVSDHRISGVAFTGSTATAHIIHNTLARRNSGIIPLIAETGGQNAMIVDSSALLEQVTDDAIVSAMGSAGQRCSALRIIYIQEDIYEKAVDMLSGALATISLGDPRNFATDVGPVISKLAHEKLLQHIQNMEKSGFKVIARHNFESSDGHFFAPHILAINSINDIPDERFGPILHIAKFKSSDLDKVIEEINSYGFGLTFGIQSRIKGQIDYISSRIHAGNIYVNRTMIGARVGTQPFGGEKNSGTGFKAGGPHYLYRFMTERTLTINLTAIGGNIDLLR